MNSESDIQRTLPLTNNVAAIGYLRNVLNELAKEKFSSIYCWNKMWV